MEQIKKGKASLLVTLNDYNVALNNVKRYWIKNR